MKEHAKSLWSEINSSLNNYWQDFLQSLPRIAFAVFILLVAWVIAKQISRLARNRLTGKAQDPLFGQFVANLIKYGLIICCIILFLHVLGLTGIAGGLMAGAGVSALIFGFAFKDIAENFLAGIILAFDRPFTLNDTVKIGEQTGHVITLNFRTTHIKTFDEKDVFIPNSKIIKETLINMTRDGILRIDFLLGIAYEDDINKALDLIVKTTKNIEGVLTEKEPFTVVEEMATSTVNIRVFFWTRTEDYKKGVLITKSTVITKIKEALIDEGFTLPAEILELKVYDKRTSLPVSIMPMHAEEKNA